MATNRNLSDLAKHRTDQAARFSPSRERRPPDGSRSVRQVNHRLYEQFTQRAQNTSTDIDRTVPKPVDHCLLTFKNSEAWLSYNDRFGDPDFYGAMTEHIEHLAGDIALQEILGPMPT
jgi:hypothetical protein